MSDILLDRVSKSFGENRIISNLSLRIPEKSVTCILGPSGCGKTTLLNLIAGILSPDSGTITGVPEKRSFVFQEDRLCEDFSGYRNIRLVTGNKRSKEDIHRHLAELSLSEEREKPVREYSGGMKRRIALARAICYDADCIFLDEPFKGLDPDRKKETMDYVRRYTESKTVLFVTHDESEAKYLGGLRLSFPLTGSGN
ncbi:MAG: ABC transporter ATP-binding protein [Clostridia bacterium]|nr:ABC transporter ATP-binding protein [Clostridia bacterium]